MILQAIGEDRYPDLFTEHCKEKKELYDEEKKKYYFAWDKKPLVSKQKGMDVDILTLTMDERYYTKTINRSKVKIAKASNAIIHFGGDVCFIAGTGEERERARDYIGWTCQIAANTGAPTWNNFGVFDPKKKFLKKKVVNVEFSDKKDGKVTIHAIEKMIEDFQSSPWIGKVSDLERANDGRGDCTVISLSSHITDGQRQLGLGKEIRDLEYFTDTFILHRGGPQG